MLRPNHRRSVLPTLLFLLLCVGAWGQSSVPFTTGLDPAFQTLSSGNVYVDPRIQGVDQSSLQQASLQAQGNPHTVVKIAMLAGLPSGYGNRNQYADNLHHDLGLGKNALILVVLGKPGAGISVVTTGLSPEESSKLAHDASAGIVTNPTAGTALLAQSVASAINNREYRGSAILWVIFFVIAGGVIALIVAASRRKKQDLGAAKTPVETLRENVLSGIAYLDNYADILPKNNPDSDQVRAFRQAASGKYDTAVKILARATETSDLYRAQDQLDRAQADIAQARRYLDRVTGGTDKIPGDDAFRPKPLPTSEAEVQAIPPNQRGVSFFSSQPAPVGSLIPVTITVGGQSRQVLATPEEANELRQGRMPAVRAFNVGGRSVPWYVYDQYDPYNDYWRYENAGWGGFGMGLAAGWIGAEMLESLVAPVGFSGYPYGVGMYGGLSDPGYGGGGYGDFQSSPDTYDNAGGADFTTDAGSTDFGGSDFGGSDFGGSDFGGSDFGGSDFGGSDFGGGDS